MLLRTIVTILLASLLACAPREKFSLLALNAAKVENVEEMAVRLRANQSTISTYKGLWHVSVTHDKSVNRFRQAILFDKIGNLRIETFPTNAAVTLGCLVVNEEMSAFYDPTEKVLFRSDDAAQLIGEFLGMPVTQNQLLELLSGAIADLDIQNYQVLQSGSEIILATDSYVWMIGTQDLKPTRLIVKDSENDRVRLEAKIVSRDVSGTPEQILIRLPSEELIIEGRASNLSINQSISASKFRINLPPGTEVREL